MSPIRAHHPSQNHLVAALPDAEFEALAPYLESWPLALGGMVYEPSQQLKHAYFPTTAVVSLHCVTRSGAVAQFSSVGNEGVVGVALCLGGDTTPPFGCGADRRPRLPPGAAPPEARI